MVILKIAICDDSERERTLLAALIEEYRQARGAEMICHEFASGVDLIENIQNSEYDLLLLNAVMPGLSGIQIASEIRRFDKILKIVFLSASAEFAMDSYSVGAYHYLIKPVSFKEICSLMDKINVETGARSIDSLVLKGRDGIVRIAFSSIEYVEVMNKTVSFHLLDGSVRDASGALADFEPQLLSRAEFVKIHRSYLMNMCCVQKLGTKGIVTGAGHAVPVSKLLYAHVKEAYMKYLFVKGLGAPKPAAAPGPIYPQPGEELRCAAIRVLLVDDDPQQQNYWAQILRGKGCIVDIAPDIETAVILATGATYDCIVLDVMLCGESSFSHCRRLSELTSAPVVFLSSLTDSDSQLQGFLSGGIDYITKDTPSELFWAKVEARIRLARTGKVQLSFGTLTIDLSLRKVLVENTELVLTPTEFDILWLLAEHSGRVYTPEVLFHAVWGTGEWDGGQSVQVHLSRMRRKLEKACPDHCFIETVWGEGYRFVPHKEHVK